MRFVRSTSSAPAGIQVGSLLSRLGTAAAYGAVVASALWFGKWTTAGLFGLMAALATAELFAFQHQRNRMPGERTAILAAGAWPLAIAAWGTRGSAPILAGLILGILVQHVLFERTRTADTSGAVFGAIYTGFLLSYVVLLRDLTDGRVLALVLVLSVWASDVFAYLVGSLLGRHKMAPRISPKKSWEGFAAGLAASVAVWMLVPTFAGITLHPMLAGGTGLTVGITAVLGDLAESRMKREAGVKDSGTSLPGHGGFLDRLDSLMFAGMAAYWILWWGGTR